MRYPSEGQCSGLSERGTEFTAWPRASAEYLISIVLSRPAPNTWCKYCWHFHLVNLSTFSQIFIAEPRGSEGNLSNCYADNSRLCMNYYIYPSNYSFAFIFPKMKIAIFFFLKKAAKKPKMCKEERELHCTTSDCSTWKWARRVSWGWCSQTLALFEILYII